MCIRDRGYVLVIGSTYNDQATELAFADLLHQGRVDGLIITSATLDSTTVARLAATALPVVVANRHCWNAIPVSFGFVRGVLLALGGDGLALRVHLLRAGFNPGI